MQRRTIAFAPATDDDAIRIINSLVGEYLSTNPKLPVMIISQKEWPTLRSDKVQIGHPERFWCERRGDTGLVIFDNIRYIYSGIIHRWANDCKNAVYASVTTPEAAVSPAPEWPRPMDRLCVADVMHRVANPPKL